MIDRARKLLIRAREESIVTYNGIAISMVYPILKAIVHKGYEAEDFGRYASLDASLLQDVEARISAEELERLMLAAAAFTRDEHFGLRQGQLMEFADMGVLGYVMMHSNTIADALEAYQRYNVILCSGFNLECASGEEEVTIRLSMQQPAQMSRHCVEDMAVSVYRLIGKLSNRPIPLKGVNFTHEATADTEPYVTAFGLLPKFGEAENALILSKDVLNYPVLYSDPRLLDVFERIARETHESLTGNNTFTNRIVAWMEKCMPSCFPTLQQTAEAFGTSTRTIQNKLKEENTTYVDLSTRVRKEIAMRYLKQKDYSVGDIAYVLHFSEPSAFQSAFKKWTGLTPGQYRANSGKERRETATR